VIRRVACFDPRLRPGLSVRLLNPVSILWIVRNGHHPSTSIKSHQRGEGGDRVDTERGRRRRKKEKQLVCVLRDPGRPGHRPVTRRPGPAGLCRLPSDDDERISRLFQSKERGQVNCFRSSRVFYLLHQVHNSPPAPKQHVQCQHATAGLAGHLKICTKSTRHKVRPTTSLLKVHQPADPRNEMLTNTFTGADNQTSSELVVVSNTQPVRSPGSRHAASVDRYLKPIGLTLEEQVWLRLCHVTATFDI